MDGRRLLLGYALALSACRPAVTTPAPEPPERAAARVLLSHFEREFREHYAPLDLKQSKGWNLDREVRSARAIIEDPKSTKADLQRAFVTLFHSLNDLHTNIFVSSDRAVWLGFHAISTDGGVRVAWVLDAPVNVGDEIVTWNGKPVAEELARISRDYGRHSTPSFDRAFNDWFLGFRPSGDLTNVPNEGDPVELGLRPGGTRRVKWKNLSGSSHGPFWPATKVSALPAPPDVTWSAPESDTWQAYSFRTKGKQYGFVRLHTYAFSGPPEQARAIADFDRAIEQFRDTDGLVIDQRGNGGGNFLLGYTMFSRLFDKPLAPVKQHYLVRGDTVVGFGTKADLLDPKLTTPVVEQYFGFGPQGDVPQYWQFFAHQDDGLTAPHFLFASAFPPRRPAYTKPVVMLIDGMALSAADYVPAALQDNHRVMLFGTSTAGAGGDQRVISTHDVCRAESRHAIATMCAPAEALTAMDTLGFGGYALTVTLGRRESGQPIENIGAKPDVEYAITAEDLTKHYEPMWRKILGEVDRLARQ